MAAFPSPARRFAPLVLILSLAGACDDEKKTEAPAQETQKSVLQGGEARTGAGKALKRGQDGVKAAEKQMEVRDAKIVGAANPEKVERGTVP